MNRETEVFTKLHAEYFPYYRSWCHDIPVIITEQRDAELRRVQQLLYRSCAFYAEHYEDYLDLISFDDKILRILEYVKDIPFRAGTFRPDYIIAEDGRVLLCEITSRFFGNGYFMSYFMEAAGEGFAKEYGVTDRRSYFEEFFSYMADLRAGHSRMSVLKSADKSDSIKLYVPFYRRLGLDVEVIEAGEVESGLYDLEGSLIISALNQYDLLSYKTDTLRMLADMGMHNDFRTVFLLHDKRFFSLFMRDSFTGRFLTEEETVFLRSHLIPTYLAGGSEEIWEDARIHRDDYILKHHCLGKSEKVYAGCLTGSDEWRSLFEDGSISSMVLQPFIRQRVFESSWNGTSLREYVSPSILCVDDRYFGTGLFRTSSCPVINQGDAHKMAPIITDQAEKFIRDDGRLACHVL
ncbi:MAG: hypothetical protein Q4G47_02410 [Lachnospiraceae bacterium]|nr:hypothetical protein [Lachnospiraceae bacterium]